MSWQRILMLAAVATMISAPAATAIVDDDTERVEGISDVPLASELVYWSDLEEGDILAAGVPVPDGTCDTQIPTVIHDRANKGNTTLQIKLDACVAFVASKGSESFETEITPLGHGCRLCGGDLTAVYKWTYPSTNDYGEVWNDAHYVVQYAEKMRRDSEWKWCFTQDELMGYHTYSCHWTMLSSAYDANGERKWYSHYHSMAAEVEGHFAPRDGGGGAAFKLWAGARVNTYENAYCWFKEEGNHLDKAILEQDCRGWYAP